MSQELIQTSAPHGLEPGSHGFCTIVRTNGMAANLAARLESLSAYRHIYLPHDPQAANNPLAYSHLVLTVGGRRVHVVSRVAAAGLDYTQRTNRFAHHVVLDSDLPPGGPAWLLLQPGVMKEAWSGPPQSPPAGPVVPKGDRRPAICAAWQRQTGDAGWGGVLAEAAAANPAREVVIIFRPGMQLLPLLAESLALLPPTSRWRVTFSTYFTGLPVDVPCLWRCVAEGTPEAAAARKTRSGKVIDLCGKLGPPPATPYVIAARTGLPPARALPEPELSNRVAGQMVRDAMGAVTAAAEVGAPLVESPGDAAFGPPLAGPVVALTPVAAKKKPKWIAYISTGAVVLAVLVGLGLAMALNDRSREADKALASIGANDEDTKETAKSKPLDAEPKEQPKNLSDPIETEKPPTHAELETRSQERQMLAERQQREKEREERDRRSRELEERRANQEKTATRLFRKLQAFNAVPRATSPGAPPPSMQVADGDWTLLPDLTFSIVSADNDTVRILPPADGRDRVWTCVGYPLRSGVDAPIRIAELSANQNGLFLQWPERRDEWAGVIANSVLIAGVGEVTKAVAMRHSNAEAMLRLSTKPNFFRPNPHRPPTDQSQWFAVSHLPKNPDLHLSLQVHGYSDKPVPVKEGVSAGTKALLLPVGSEKRQAVLLIDISARAMPNDLRGAGIVFELKHTEFRNSGYPERLRDEIKQKLPRHLWPPKVDFPGDGVFTLAASDAWQGKLKDIDDYFAKVYESENELAKQNRKAWDDWKACRDRCGAVRAWLKEIDTDVEKYMDRLRIGYRVCVKAGEHDVVLLHSGDAASENE